MNDSAAYSRLDSTLDKSVNFFKIMPDGGMIETRFVQRRDDRFIVYISSMTGCDKACRFCHLTQTGQTMNTMISQEEMLDQARQVLTNVDLKDASTVHFNFMARGEPLSNPAVDAALFKKLASLAAERGLKTRIKISTILPLDVVTEDGSNLFDKDCPPVDLYYSLYSVDERWRKRWIPKAKAPATALYWLKRFQQQTGNRVILHWALIEGENDDLDGARNAFSLAQSVGVMFDFNLVRYNPANEKSEEASPDRLAAFVELADSFTGKDQRTRVVTRVGFDVAASCGMFLSAERV